MVEAWRVGDLRETGVTRHTIETRMLVPYRGIRADVLADDLRARALLFAPRLGPGAFYSHATAAGLWGAPLPAWATRDPRLHVSYPAGHRAPDARETQGHELQVGSSDTVILDGIPIASPARTVRDLATILQVPDLVAVIDAMLRAGVVDRAALDRMAAVRRFRWRRRVLAAVELADPAAETRPESLLRVAYAFAGLPPTLANDDIRDAHGRFVARPDLRFRGFPVLSEYDGDGHRTDTRQWRRDVERYAALEDLGFEIVRVTADDIPHFERAIAHARTRLLRHGWRP